MIDHISLGVRDIARAQRFYDATLAPLGYRRLHTGADGLGYGGDFTRLWLSATEHPVPPDMRSGLHVCFAAKSRADVDRFHAAGLATGGRDNGKPGVRPDYSGDYYTAFVIDPDGYRIEAYCGEAA